MTSRIFFNVLLLISLFAVNSAYAPAFTPEYQRVLTIGPSATTAGAQELQRTWLRTAVDR